MDQMMGYYKLFDVLPFACFVINENNYINYSNPVIENFLYPTKGEVFLNSSILDHILEEDRENFTYFIDPTNSSENKRIWRTFQFVDSDGVSKKILINGVINLQKFGAEGLRLIAGMPLFSRSTELNLTDHYLDEKIEISNKYERIFNNATVGITIFNSQGAIEETNKYFCSLLGRTKDKLLQHHFSEFFNEMNTGKIEYLITLINLNHRSFVKDVLTINNDDHEHVLLEVSLSPIGIDENNQQKFMMITEDITGQHDTHIALLQSEKLALTGRLAASLAHEINNPLQTSIGCLGLVEEMLEDKDNDLKVYINMAMEELQRSARIVKKLRDLNRKADSTDKSPVDLSEVLEGVLVLTQKRLNDKDIFPVVPNQGSKPMVLASRDQIQQVILNLVMNAIDALPDGGKIYFDIFESEKPLVYTLKIRDTGIGMQHEVMDQLFNPFFTTKDEGLGLGLYICKNIIEDHHGSLNVKSEPNKGTEFSITLPGFDISGEED